MEPTRPPRPVQPTLSPNTGLLHTGESQVDFQSFLSNTLNVLVGKVDGVTQTIDILVQDNVELKEAIYYSNKQVKELAEVIELKQVTFLH